MLLYLMMGMNFKNAVSTTKWTEPMQSNEWVNKTIQYNNLYNKSTTLFNELNRRLQNSFIVNKAYKRVLPYKSRLQLFKKVMLG